MKNITVIIPCFNGYKYMDKCLSALENQTYKDFNVIVVDDCSTDDSYQQLLDYQKNTLLEMTVIRNDKNLRLAFTRLEGVKRADTEWICFCDCDDWYETDFFEKMLSKAEESDSEMVMCHFNYAYKDGRKKFLSGLNILDDSSTKEEFIAFAPMSLCRFLFKRKLYDNLIIKPINNAEDGMVTPQLLAKSNKITIIHEGLYNYFIRENSLSFTPKPSVYYDFLTAQQVIDDTIGTEYPLECEFIAIKNFCYGAILNGLKSKVDLKVIKKDYNHFLMIHPLWYKNKYIGGLSRAKRLFLKMLRCRLFWILKMYAAYHSFWLKKKPK